MSVYSKPYPRERLCKSPIHIGHAENDVDGTSIQYDKEKARDGDQVELDKCNKNELNSIDKENIVRRNYNCKERPYNYFTKDDY